MSDLIREACQKFAQRGTTDVADALGKTGGVPGITPIPGNLQSIAAPIFYAEAYGRSNWPIHETLREVPAGSFVFIEGLDVDDRAIIGGLIMSYLWKKRGAVGAVVVGNVRDMPDLISMKAPLWARGTTPVGCYNRQVPPPTPEVREAYESKARISYGDPRGGIAVADATGVVIVPADRIEETYKAVHAIEQREHEWFAALDEGYNTYDIVCVRSYAEHP